MTIPSSYSWPGPHRESSVGCTFFSGMLLPWPRRPRFSSHESWTDTHSSRSASFYPQPISNWYRKNTLGLAIDFPTLNVLGFSCYTVSTAAFLFSPVIREQYAYRHPSNPDTTMRFNDFLFAAHGAVLCIIIYSQFFPSIWGFRVGAKQRASKAVLAIFWACVLAILFVVLLARFRGSDKGYNPDGWAWIDVVRTSQFSRGRRDD